MIAGVAQEGPINLAIDRGHIVDGRDSRAPASARLRQAPSEEFSKAIDEPLRKKVDERTKKPEKSMWTDDALRRTLAPGPDTVHHVMARMALVDLGLIHGRGTGTFDLRFHFDPGPLDQDPAAKHLVERFRGGHQAAGTGRRSRRRQDDPRHPARPRDGGGAAECWSRLRLRGAAEAPDGLAQHAARRQGGEPARRAVTDVRDLNGGDTLAMYAAYGKALAESLLALHQQSFPSTWPNTFYPFA